MLKISDDAFPFVIAVVSGEITEADVTEMARRYTALHARGRRFYLAQEVRQVSLPSAPMRRRLAELNTEFGDRIAKNIVGIGIVVPSRIVSAAMTAIYWVSKEASPTHFFPSAAALAEHARRTCAAEKVVLPTALESIASALDGAWRDGRELIGLDLGVARSGNAA